MILFEINKNLEFGGIPITDWIQSAGALIAIVAALIGFIQLFRKSHDNQLQIDSLTQLAKQSENQTEHLAAQVEQMIEGNQLQVEHINLLQKSLSIIESDSRLKEEQMELQDKRRKFDIRPRIEMNGAARGPAHMNCFFNNKGGTAKITGFEELETNSCSNNISLFIDREIETNKSFEIHFNAPPNLKLAQCNVSVKLFFTDIDDNEYSQIIEGNPISGIKVNKAVESK
ncbi:MAG TPA: hypothetical protein VMV56_02810 [Williamwhitmania sp.]|nr:hypothetical protein [Williamwhitmania sp.]